MVMSSKALNPRAVDAKRDIILNYYQKANEPAPDARDLEQVETYHDVVWRCIQTKSEDFSEPELRLYQGTPRNPGDEITDHALLELLDRPAPDISGKEWRRMVCADLDATGDSFNFIYRNGPGVPASFARFRPHEIVVDPDPTGRRNIGSYRWLTEDGLGTLGLVGPGKLEAIPWDRMLHFKQGNPATVLRGLGALHRLRMVLETWRVMDEWNWNRFANGIPTEYLIFFNGQFQEGERAEAEARLRGKFTGPGGDNFMLLEGDGEGNKQWDVQAWPRPSEKELGFLAMKEMLVYAIGRAFNVPPNKLMDYQQSTRIANADAMERTYWEDGIMSLHTIFVDTLNSRYIPLWFPGEKIFLQHDYSTVRALQQSALEKANIHAIYIDRGAFTRNEVRVELGHEEVTDVPEMDQYLNNGRPLGSSFSPLDELFGGAGRRGEPGGRPPGRDDDPPQPPLEEDGEKRALWLLALDERRKQESPVLIQEPLLDLDEEEAIFRRLVAAKLRIMVERAAKQHLELSGISATFDVDDPEVLRFIESMTVELVEAVVKNTNEMVRARIAEGYEEGLDEAEMRERLQSAFRERRADWQLDRIARTESHHAQEGASFQASLQTGVEFKRWLSSRDSRVRGLDPKDAADHDGMEDLGPIPLDAPFVDSRSGAQLMFPGDRDGARSGADTINCFPGDTLVRGEFVGGLKAWYAGPLVVLETARGHRLTVTPNHPVLTSKGWTPANDLSKGDCLASYAGPVECTAQSRGIDQEHGISSIKEVFEALCEDLEPLRVKITSLDLDGDAPFTSGEIDVVGTNSGLRNESKPILAGALEGELVAAAVSATVGLSGARHLKEAGCAVGSGGRPLRFSDAQNSSPSAPGFVELSVNNRIVGARPFGVLGSALVTEMDIASTEETCDHSSRHPVLVGETLDTLAIAVAGDECGGVGSVPRRPMRQPRCVGLFPEWDSLPTKPSEERSPIDSKFLGKLTHAAAGAIVEDELVRVTRVPEWRGHVYDLQSTSGWIVANGVVASQCRCSWLADHSHLDLGARGGRVKAPTFDEAWHSKASRRDDMALELKRLVRRFIFDMERRALAAYGEDLRRQAAAR